MTMEACVSDEVRRVFQWIVSAALCLMVDLFGSLANIINIVCFVKQGFKDSVNISLLGLAISDLGVLSTLIFTNICLNPAFQESELSFDTVELQYLITGLPHTMFIRATSCITALITLERCLCITMPLKVKTILTPQRSTIIIVAIFILLTFSVSPLYYANNLGWKFSPLRNQTIYGLVFAPYRDIVESFSFAMNNVIIPFGAFTMIIVCTVVLVVNLRGKAKWREGSTTSGAAQLTTHRDRKVTRMVVVISALFIASFSPVCVIFFAMLLVPGLSVDGQFYNTLVVVIGLGFLLESINSSINIFIYYKMSSKYRTIFRQLFGLYREDDKK